MDSHSRTRSCWRCMNAWWTCAPAIGIRTTPRLPPVPPLTKSVRWRRGLRPSPATRRTLRRYVSARWCWKRGWRRHTGFRLWSSQRTFSSTVCFRIPMTRYGVWPQTWWSNAISWAKSTSRTTPRWRPRRIALTSLCPALCWNWNMTLPVVSSTTCRGRYSRFSSGPTMTLTRYSSWWGSNAAGSNSVPTSPPK